MNDTKDQLLHGRRNYPKRGVYYDGPSLSFPSLDKAKQEEIEALRKAKMDAEADRKKKLNDEELERQRLFREEMLQCEKQGGINRLSPGMGYLDGDDKIKEFLKEQ